LQSVSEILLLAEADIGSDLSRRLGQTECVSFSDPYDALMEMGRRRFGTVLLTGSNPEFAGLCRAVHRLQPDSRVLAICSPATEPEVRPLAGELLDDYFIYPPTSKDISRILNVALQEKPRTSGAAEQSPALTPRQFSSLVEAAHNMISLEAKVAELIGSKLGTTCEWVDTDKFSHNVRPLLLAAGNVPRVLVPANPTGAMDQECEAFLTAIQESLPALVATASRTESLHRLAITDHLTGAYNRRYLYNITDQILLRAAQNDYRVTLLLYDIDDFKRYNDTYGHAAGDEILRETAALMKRITRSHDIVARIGGDEFAVLFWDGAKPRSPDSRPPESAFALADRFRRTVSNHEFSALGPEATGVLSISGGLASYPHDGKSCRELLRSADKALKSVKKTGKNAIRLIGPAE